jgi:hypothetical protein
MFNPAEYCSTCTFPYRQMGACPIPDRSIFWAYLSMVPYLIPIIIFIVMLFTKRIKHFKSVALLASCYIIGDKVIKNLIRSIFGFR